MGLLKYLIQFFKKNPKNTTKYLFSQMIVISGSMLGTLERTISLVAIYSVWTLLLQLGSPPTLTPTPPPPPLAPLRMQVPYEGATAPQVEHVLSLLQGCPGKIEDLNSVMAGLLVLVAQ